MLFSSIRLTIIQKFSNVVLTKVRRIGFSFKMMVSISIDTLRDNYTINIGSYYFPLLSFLFFKSQSADDLYTSMCALYIRYRCRCSYRYRYRYRQIVDVYYYTEIVKYFKQYKYPLAWESINKLWQNHIMKYAAAVKI